MSDQFKDLRLDMDEDVRLHYQKRERSNGELFAIIFIAVFTGILAADGMRLLIVNAWVNYQLEEAAKEFRRTTDRISKETNERIRQQAIQEQNQVAREAYDRKFNSYECKFWRDVNAVNPSTKTRQGLAQHCP